jgi:hypothetical protein
MKTFNEIVYEGMDVSHFSPEELNESIQIYYKLNEIVEAGGLQELEIKIREGILGGIAGFLVGPAIGKVIANALGIERGILYDMFTSRLVGAALGSAIQRNM